MNLTEQERLTGLLLGGAVGDALGLPAEGLTAARQRKWWPGELRHRFVLGGGMISDDTEHALMTAQALLEADGDVERSRRALAWKLRWWFIALPAGVGLATARACLRLWVGVTPARSGVNSAGNGPAMRSSIIGAVFARDVVRRRNFVSASTRLTHTDPRAETAALAVAEAAAWIMNGGESQEALLLRLRDCGSDEAWLKLCQRLADTLASQETVAEFAATLGLANGVTGYAYHTVPVALFAWLRHPGDFRQAVESAIRCGGDTDTMAAITGSLAGCATGKAGIPGDWLAGLHDWPRSTALIETIGERLAGDSAGGPVGYCWPGVLPRNLLFLLVVLTHGFRRLLPPY